jgi:hypothetical protein
MVTFCNMNRPLAVIFLLSSCAIIGASALVLLRDDAEAKLDITPVEFSPWRYTESSIHRLVISPNDKYFAVITDHLNDHESCQLIVVDRHSGQELIRAESRFIRNLCFDSRDSYIAAAMFDGLVVFDLQERREVLTVGWQELDYESTMAMGFSFTSDCITMQAYSVFGFNMQSSRVAFQIPSGKPIADPDEPAFWYGDRLSRDGSRWWSGGLHGPTPRVFDRNNSFIAYCPHEPDIRNAWFSRKSDSLVSWHSDGKWVRWDLSHVKDKKAAPVIIRDLEIPNATLITLMNTHDSIISMEQDGKAWLYPIP